MYIHVDVNIYIQRDPRGRRGKSEVAISPSTPDTRGLTWRRRGD